MGMTMVFNTNDSFYLLFEPICIKPYTYPGDLTAACVVMIIVALLNELVKAGRQYHIDRYLESRNPDISRLPDSSLLPRKVIKRLKLFSATHLAQTAMHTFQITISYLIMLAVMTFNVWIGVSVVIGAAIGYFFSSWFQVRVNDVNDHCN